jgi:hypothetical protein
LQTKPIIQNLQNSKKSSEALFKKLFLAKLEKATAKAVVVCCDLRLQFKCGEAYKEGKDYSN